MTAQPSEQPEQPAPAGPDMSGIDPTLSMSPLMVSALAAREQMMCWRRAGFSRREAFTLLRDMFHDYRMIHAGYDGDGDDD